MHPQPSGEDGQPGQPEPTYSPAPHGQPAQYEQPPQYGQPAPYGQLPVQYPQQVGQPPPDDPLVSADYGGWWRRAIAIIRVAWPQLLVLNLVGAVVGTVLQTPLAVVLSRLPLKVEESLASDEFTFGIGDVLAGLGATAALLTIGVAVAAVVSLATLRVSFAAAIGAPVRVGEGLSTAGRRLLPLLGWHLLALPMVLVGVCACLLPGLYFTAVLAVLPAVVVFERGVGIGRCFKLFHGRFGASLARMATILAMYPIVGAITSVVANIVEAGFNVTDPDDPKLIVSSVLSSAVTSIGFGALAILTTPLLLTAYADMRARVEPFTTATLVQSRR
jgi:hypothetical protein